MNPPSRFIAELPEQYIQKVSKVQQAWNSVSKGLSAWREKSQYQSYRNREDTDGFSSMPNYDDFDDSTDSSNLKKGMKVRHPSFGVGMVHQLEGQGESQKVTILFPNNTLKKFVVKFARLEKV
jgi:DNA helicase-2/ATP-dependent DNA helicase PcrA